MSNNLVQINWIISILRFLYLHVDVNGAIILTAKNGCLFSRFEQKGIAGARDSISESHRGEFSPAKRDH